MQIGHFKVWFMPEKSKLALKIAVWAVNLFMKAHIFSMGRVEIIENNQFA